MFSHDIQPTYISYCVLVVLTSPEYFIVHSANAFVVHGGSVKCCSLNEFVCGLRFVRTMCAFSMHMNSDVVMSYGLESAKIAPATYL